MGDGDVRLAGGVRDLGGVRGAGELAAPGSTCLAQMSEALEVSKTVLKE